MKCLLRGIAAAALAVLLTACGSASASEPDPLRIAGDYVLAELYRDDGTSLNTQVAELYAAGETVTLHLAEDGTGTYTIFEEAEAVTWTETTLTFGGETLELSRTKDTLTVYTGGGTEGKMVFVPAETAAQ